jgi:hypothetical protein
MYETSSSTILICGESGNAAGKLKNKFRRLLSFFHANTLLLASLQRDILIEHPQQLSDPLFPATMSGRWVLHGKRMKTSIMTTESQPFIRNPMTPHTIYYRQNAIDLDKVGIVVFMLAR